MQERLRAFDATIEAHGAQCTAAFHAYSEPALVTYILSWGSGVRVLEPASLRTRVVAEARRIIEFAADGIEFATDTTLSAV